ncbi:MAG: fatty acid desaturase [Alphaproteobacteria bacterium]|nr:fatty acid desaturase [Alphaproteobacteria bacterium]
MAQDAAVGGGVDPNKADIAQRVEPSLLNALPHYLPLGIFPLIYLAASYGGWWLLPPLLFMSVAGPLDRALGLDGRNMDPANTPKRRLLWHNFPVWTWALLWPPTLIFGMWQILVAPSLATWEGVVLAIILTMEAQAVFVIGHELIHRPSTWESRLGEFLLASASYPQYATEHVYVHHAKVGTPHDVGSAAKGESFWRYFPKEIGSNLTNSWKIVGERLARRNLPRWHYSNPFWRYGLAVAIWFGLAYWMGGVWAIPVFTFLGLCCVFSMNISNYFQHYGLRRVRLPNGRWEKVMPRHSWSADWKFSNWMFFNMQRHADHHAVASRHYPLLQVRSADESPELPGTYADMMNIVLRPKRWFAKMDPLVDQWRKRFYPEIDDWSAYDSQISAARPDAFEAIVEIFGVAPRLAKWIERNSELLDSLQEREFTDLDLPRGFGPDPESERIARRGLARLYWTHEMDVREMKELIAELPAVDAKETAEVVRNWANDKTFQIGMHVVRGNLSSAEARTALSNVPEASISIVVSAVIADFVDRVGPSRAGWLAVVLLDDLASREAHPGAMIDILFIHDGWRPGGIEPLCRRFRETLTDLAGDSLLFSPIPRDTESLLAVPLSELAERGRIPASGAAPVLTRARCLFEYGDSEIGRRFGEARREVLAECGANESLMVRLRAATEDPAEPGVANYARMRGGLNDVERAARFLQVTNADASLDDPAPTAQAVFDAAGAGPLAQAATLWRDLEGITRLIGEEGFDTTAAGPKVRALVANACGYADFDALNSAVAETASRAAARIDTLLSRA